MIKRYLVLFSFSIICLSFFTCRNKQSQSWWTSADSIAVYQELSAWQDSLNGYHFLQGLNNVRLLRQIDPLGISVPLTHSDTISSNGKTINKIAHFLSSYDVLGDKSHIDSLDFNTIRMNDTFCFVTYQDITRNTIGILKYDSLWTVKFKINSVDTNVTPPETTWSVDSIIKTGFTTYEEDERLYPLNITRYLELKKDKAVTHYQLKYLTGWGLHIPDLTSSPVISNVVLSQPGRTDTFYDGSRSDCKGIYNLKSKDSLCSVNIGESLNVYITTTTPADTLTDRNYFFISCGIPYVSTKYNVTKSARIGEKKVVFTHAGLNHLYIEVIPASVLFYPFSQWKSTTWAIPIRVKSYQSLNEN